MDVRKLFLAAVAVSVGSGFVGCGDRNAVPPSRVDSGTRPDAGQDAGPPPTTPTVQTIDQVKKTANYKGFFEVDNVLVSEVIYAKPGKDGAFRADFWVQDPALEHNGLFVSKYYTDVDNAYLPKPGDKVDLVGWFNTVSNFAQQTGYRFVLEDAYAAFGDAGTTDGNLHVVVHSSGNARVPDVTTPAGFGNAESGAAHANSDYAGARVHIPGPLTITNLKPPALQNVNDPTKYYGFEVTGGILVNDYRTATGNWTDSGTPTSACDFRTGPFVATTFPNGISGVYDTYTATPCKDGGVDPYGCSKGNSKGHVPGVDAGYTYVLYPETCADLSTAN